jgi:hypothetical protein
MIKDDIALMSSSIRISDLPQEAFDAMKADMVGAGITNPITDFNNVGQLANLARSVALSKNTDQSKAAMRMQSIVEKTVFAKYAS